jgi:hypothetical protein
LDGILDVVDNIDNERKVEWLLADVEPLKLQIPFFEFDESDPYLAPCRFKGTPKEELIRSRASSETTIYGKTRFPNTLAIVRFSVNTRYGSGTFQDLYCIRWLKYYLQEIGSFDAFVENSRGFISEIKVDDCMVATRCCTFLNGAIAEAQDLMPGYKSVIQEVVMNLFRDPWHETLFLKDNTSILKQFAFANAPIGKGSHPVWAWDSDQRVLNDYFFKPVTGNDADILQLPEVQEAIAESVKELKSKGYSLLAQFYVDLLSMAVTKESTGLMSMGVFIEAFCGFMRGNPDIAHTQSIEEIPSHTDEIPAYADHLRDIWWDAFDTIWKKGWLYDYDEWVSRLMGFMTTKSAGGASVQFTVSVNGKKYDITARDKLFVMLADPYTYLDPQKLKDCLTPENPGKIATRYVAARKIRAVYQLPLEYYVTETLIGNALLKVQAEDPELSLASEFGRFLADHAPGLYHCSVGDSIIVLMDFSSFDTYQGWENMRRFALEAFQSWARERQLTEKFGPWPSLSVMMETLWTKVKKAWFEVGNKILSLNILLSGEYMTITTNNHTNKANFRSIMDALWTQIPDTMSKVVVKPQFQGDDSITLFTKVSPWDIKDIVVIRDVIVRVAQSDGLKISALKTSVRRWYMEYLKKSGMYGYVVGRLSSLQILCAERPSFQEHPMDVIRSYRGLLSEYVSRGGDHEFCRHLLLYTWNMRRRVKYKVEEGYSLYSLPVGALWTPGELKGGDAPWWTLLGASTSALSFQMYKGTTRDYINYCAYVLDVDVGIYRNKIAENVLDSPDSVFSKGVKFMREGLKPGLLELSQQALLSLDQVGIDMKRWSYAQYPRRFVTRSIADNPRLGEIVREEKKSSVRYMKARVGRLSEWKAHYYVTLANWDRLLWFLNYCRDMFWYTFDVKEDPTYTNLMGKTLVTIVKEGADIILGSEEELRDASDSLSKIIIPNNIWDIPQEEFENYISDIIPHSNEVFKNYIYEKYSWQKPLYFEYVDEEIPYLHEDVPICGVSPDIVDLMRRVGISSRGDESIIRLTKMAAQLVHSSHMPPDITSEVLVSLLSNPAISSSPDNIMNALISMGASTSEAASFAINFYEVVSKYLMVSTSRSFSTQDQIIGYLNLTYASIKRIVDFSPLSNPSLERYLTGLAVLYALINPHTLTKVRVMVKGSELQHLTKEMLQGLFGETAALVDYYPTFPV